MNEIKIPDGRSGDWTVETFTVTKEESLWTRIRAIHHPMKFVPEGEYQRLRRNGTIVMSTTPMERRTHNPIICMAYGSVLLNGLGLGYCLGKVLQRSEVERVTVIEISPDVIRLVAPSFAGQRVEIIQADAFTWKPPAGVRYNAVWHDIWNEICEDNLPEMTRLKRKYGRRCGWQACWSEDVLRRNRW